MTHATTEPAAPESASRDHAGVALVTGASRGVGRAVALALAREGYDVSVGFVASADAAASVVQEIDTLGRRAVAIQADVRTGAGIAELTERTVSSLGPIKVLVSNATGYPAGTTMEHFIGGLDPSLGLALGTSPDNYRETFDARVLAFLGLARAAVPSMPAGGSIIGITSTGTRVYMPGYGPTGSAMAAVEMISRYLAVELGPRGIRVNVVSGGLLRTDALNLMTGDVERLEASVAKRTPLGRVGTPEDMADVVAFVASDQARWITGQTLVVDGGHSVR